MTSRRYLFIISTAVLIIGIILISVGAVVYRKSIDGDYNSKVKNPVQKQSITVKQSDFSKKKFLKISNLNLKLR